MVEREFATEKSPIMLGQNQDPVRLPTEYIVALFI